LKPLHKIAAKCCQNVYRRNIDIGTTEYSLKYGMYKGKVIQILAIPGFNEFLDGFRVINVTSWEGIKLGAYKAAHKIHNRIKHKIRFPLLVSGHSMGAGSAIAYHKLFESSWCCAFDPVRVLRRWATREMENTYLFINKNDLIPKAGFINFGHPKCEIEYIDNNLSVKEAHNIDNWV